MRTPIWRLTGLRGSEPGELQLSQGRLRYSGANGAGFDIALEEVRGVNFPWYYFSGGFKMQVGGEEYRFSFVEPHNEHADIKTGREIGKQWKKVLANV